MKIKVWFALGFIAPFISLSAQEVKILAEGTKISFRGLSITPNCIWASGSGGTIVKSADAGKSWQWYTVKDYEDTEFRDIEAFDNNTAIIMGIAAPAYILKTTDGGTTWKKVYENKHPAIFLDALAFKSAKKGIVIGDPINDKIFVAETKDGGDSWRETNRLLLPGAKTGEAFFAASGTNVVWSRPHYYIVSGGMSSRIFFNAHAIQLPTCQGQQMAGANGLAIQGKTILVAAGNYKEPQDTDSAFVYSTNKGKTWQLPTTMPHGYRSSVCFIAKNVAVTCGLSGIDITYDGGKTWQSISKKGFNTCAYSRKEHAVYFAGNNGRLGKLLL